MWVEIKPWGPESPSSLEIKPRLASFTASTPFAAAIPALKGLPIVPNWDFKPDARVLTIPTAICISTDDNPINRPAAIVAPNAPAVAV